MNRLPRRPCAYCRRPTVVTREQAQTSTLYARYTHSPTRKVKFPPICHTIVQGMIASALVSGLPEDALDE